ncbi:1-phosphatidylinositol-3-phosphate 5-kinase [Bertholletia excelsa]
MGAKDDFREGASVSNRRIISADPDILGNHRSQEVQDNIVESAMPDCSEETEQSHSSESEIDDKLWLPPEAEAQEHDMEGCVIHFDKDEGDEEYSDGTKSVKPSCLNGFGGKGTGRCRFRGEKQKAMKEVMNGKFKALVSELLRSVGVSSSGEDGNGWLDTVTSLSWEAASYVKPEAVGGKAMDPDGYVKIKCVATGSRNQSQVIGGLVFKKRATHKHMPIMYRNARLLLIRGTIGQSSSGLSSFDSMHQEKDSVKSIIETMENCHPNVILVEQTVSRDIQDSILARGITLVFDMKLHRLERIARCTGSSILSTNLLDGQELRCCDSFHFEKFIEEHRVSGNVGKKPSKTLMFIEGCPTRLGCTILLKGAHTDELKKIKCVVQCAVIMAYHVILETSFLQDQFTMFSTLHVLGVPDVPLADQLSLSIQTNNSNLPYLKEPSAETDSPCSVDIPISNEFHEEDSIFFHEPYNPIFLSGLLSLSLSLKKAIKNGLPVFSTASKQSLYSYFGFNGRDSHNETPTKSSEVFDHFDVVANGSSDDDKSSDHEQLNSPSSGCEASSDLDKSVANSGDQMQINNGISTLLDSESMLVMMSSQNALKGTFCEQSHLSRIKFYRSFDASLGKFLQDNLLNQRLHCATCNEPPQSHFYYYVHHNKQLIIQIKHLPESRSLPGEAEGKLWMWSKCGKCKSSNGNSKSTKRVLISNAACGLSFGRFLELCFSNHSSFTKTSDCGHSVHKDFLYFFGFGSMVAMLRSSSIATYSVSPPPQKLSFSNPIRGNFLEREIEIVHLKGMHFFEEVAKHLQEVASEFSDSNFYLGGKLKAFSDIKEMLNQERGHFEVKGQNLIFKHGNPEQSLYKSLSLNRFQCDLLVASCIWDQRLQSLLSSNSEANSMTKTGKSMQTQAYFGGDGDAAGEVNSSHNGSEVFDGNDDVRIELEVVVESNEFPVQEIPIEGAIEPDEQHTSSIIAEDIRKLNASGNRTTDTCTDHNSCQEEKFPFIDDFQVDRTSFTTNLEGSTHISNMSQRGLSDFPLLAHSENFKGWVWASLPEIQEEFLKVLQQGYNPKLEYLHSYTAEKFPTAFELITEGGSRLHIPLVTNEYMVSDYEDEFSSIIACALALLADTVTPTEVLSEDTRRSKLMIAKTYEISNSITRVASLASPRWSSFGSLDSDGTNSPPSLEESRLSSFDGFNLLDSLISTGASHPEISMGFGNIPGKHKYSVVCLYANQFRDLRCQCCSSELDYIASLSRCRNWDAKGGKSKSFFAKTLDERFIIKEIKKTEFESFMKFAPDYFRYMNECFDQGNQTCLAKILGIYQVVIRQAKSGKEIKRDLMVMENLSFGRIITRQYDLKGALHCRFNPAADGSGDVLLDQNFVNDMNASPLYVGMKSKHHLERAVWNDTTFLNSINVMDYSLLVGVDAHKHELVCGIIDYLRQYTWDKQLETWVKSSLVPKNHRPTVISPWEYKKRFRKFITTHFLSVPDYWCQKRSSKPCKLCGMGEDDDSSDTNSQDQDEEISFPR